MKNYQFDTKAIHAAQSPDIATHSRTAPIYQTTAYTFESVEFAKDLFELKENGDIYTRITNPTNAILEGRLAALDDGVGAVAFASGHAAMTACISNLASCGDEIVSSINIYGGAINLFGVTFKNYGINFKFVDPANFDEWEKAITSKTKALFAEAVGNPNADVADIEKLAQIAHKHNIPLIIDSTFTTPYLQKAFDFGADIVIHSATKFLGGHGTSMAGIVVDSGNFNFKNNDKFPQYNTPDQSY
ncbi:MAG: aminotransferase class I/II-fold pyridoxal phosphate-dependent enzyme, partial [Oscillospiraceae bacterium]